MEDNEQKAMQLMATAEKKLSSSQTFFGSVFGGSSTEGDAVDCYRRAANLFKMAKKWPQAGQAFCKAAQLHLKAGSRHDAATDFVDASTCFKKCDRNEAVSCLQKAIQIYTEMGRFKAAASQHQNIAELYETECVDLGRAMQHYEQAADYFRGEEATSSATKCLLKIAQYAAQLEQYDKAIEIYEEVATLSLGNSLMKHNAKEHMFRAALCHLCVDILNGQLAVEKFCGLYPAFADTRECKLVKELTNHLEEQNVDAFSDAIMNAHITNLQDQWYQMMFMRIKKQIDNPELC